MIQLVCPYCGGDAVYVDSAELFSGKSYGMVYLCRPCRAYVGVHKGTDQPLGKLADRATRDARKAAHEAFDQLWRSPTRILTRHQAYGFLATALGISREDCHIALFDEEMCQRVVRLCETRGAAVRRQHQSVPSKSNKERTLLAPSVDT